jgi:hypothetical protein
MGLSKPYQTMAFPRRRSRVPTAQRTVPSRLICPKQLAPRCRVSDALERVCFSIALIIQSIVVGW